MKNLVLVVCFSVAIMDILAQNVGIGIPTPSAKLMVASTSTEAEPTLKLFDFSSNRGPRLDFRNAGGGFTWKIFTVIDNGVAANSFFKLGYNSELAPLLTIRGNNTVGINQELPAYPLDVSGDLNVTGAFRINGDPGTAGQALISNASSAPSWQTIAQNPAIGFSAYLNGSVALVSGTSADLVTYGEFFDDGNVFNAATGEFTAPSTGLYHFDVKLNLSLPAAGTAPFYVRYLKNGVIFVGCQADAVFPANSSFSSSLSYSINLKLVQNDVIKLHVNQSSGVSLNVVGGSGSNNSVFSGYKVY